MEGREGGGVGRGWSANIPLTGSYIWGGGKPNPTDPQRHEPCKIESHSAGQGFEMWVRYVTCVRMYVWVPCALPAYLPS